MLPLSRSLARGLQQELQYRYQNIPSGGPAPQKFAPERQLLPSQPLTCAAAPLQTSSSSTAHRKGSSSKQGKIRESTQSLSRVESNTQEIPNAVSYSVMGAGIFTAIPFLMMILIPRVLQVRMLIRSYWTFAPLAVAYMGLLAYSYTPDMLSLLLPGSLEAGMSGFNPQFFPQLSGIQQLFKGPATIASIILHILSINLFLGRGIYLNGLSSDVPTRHSLLATFLLGPPGLLLHWITKAVWTAFPQLQRSKSTCRNNNGRTITMYPYK